MNTMSWRKSSYSGPNGAECVEVAGNWRKSSHSGDNGGECVEVAGPLGMVAMRDSKDRSGPELRFSASAWRTFTGEVKADAR
ncbi:MAG TPA: DUF397 domain-containing protein [Streptosporangiaceae bacterium]|jgi:hypothetical protein